MRIIYANNDGTIAIVVPSEEWLNSNTIEELARKDVPVGVDYWIVEDSEVPSDRTFRNAWELNPTDLGTPDGQGIGAEAWFAEQEVTDENPS